MNLKAWKYFIGLYVGNRRRLILTITLSIAQSVSTLPIIFLIRYAFDNALPNRDITLLIWIGVGVVALLLINTFFILRTMSINLNITKTAVQLLRNKLLDKSFNVSRSFYNQADSGKLHSNFVHDSYRLENMSDVLVLNLIPAIVMGLSLGLLLLYLNWQLFLAMISVFPAFFVVNRVLGKVVRDNVQKWREMFRDFSRGVLFVYEKMNLIRIQTAEPFEIERRYRSFNELRKSSAQMKLSQTIYSTWQNAIVGLSVVIVLIIGGIAISAGVMTIGDLFSFYAALVLLRRYMGPLLTSIPQLIEGNESLISLHEFLNTDDPVEYSGQKKINFKGEILLDGVVFNYNNNDPILENLGLTIPERSIIAILGANGAGKSTILNLILGFYRPQFGQLYADGNPYEEIDLQYLRQSIGVVTQEPIVFNGTILENIIYGMPELDNERVKEAAILSNAHEFIKQLPDGCNTLIGENGVRLSGGQRQRISLARAFIRKPKLLILDEPTNHLDDTTAKHVFESLRTINENATILIVTHDNNIINIATDTYLLENGCLRFLPKLWSANSIRNVSN